MPRRRVVELKGIFVTMVGLALFYGAYVLLTLFAVPITPVEYKAPPKLAQQVQPSADSTAAGADVHELVPATPAPASPVGEEIETLAKGALFEGQSPEEFIALFNHPDPETREAAARALARCHAANGGMVEPRAEGAEFMRRYELMEKFWENADKPAVLNALLELTSASVETGGSEFGGDDDLILYLLAWSPELNSERAEILAWVANHHPRSDMRRAAMFFLVENNAFSREVGDEVLDSRTHDPALRVRVEAWTHRMRRIFF